MAVQVNRKLIRELRLRSSYSQEKLAEIAGVNLRTIQRIEKEGLASLQTRAALATAFGVTPKDLDVAKNFDAMETARHQHSKLFPLGITITIFLFAIGVAFATQFGQIYSSTGTIGAGMRGLLGLILLLICFSLLARAIDLSRWRPCLLLGAVAISLLAVPLDWIAQFLVILPVWVVFETSLVLARAVHRRMTHSPSS